MYIMEQFLEKWGAFVDIEGHVITTDSTHLYRRWRHRFEHDVKALKGPFEILYDPSLITME
jgi:hypothetical protein